MATEEEIAKANQLLEIQKALNVTEAEAIAIREKSSAILERLRGSQIRADKIMAELNRSNSKVVINLLKEEENEVKKLAKNKLISYEMEKSALSRLARDKETAADAGTGKFRKGIKDFSESWLDLGDIIKKTGYGAIAMFILAQIDAQKKLQTLAGTTIDLYGKFGHQAGNDFGYGFTTTTTDAIAFVTNNMRAEFLEAAKDVGVPISGLTGNQFKVLTDKLLLLGKAFNISSQEMASDIFVFQDILGKTTAEAGKDITMLANTSLALQVAPARLLRLTTDLVGQYKLQKTSLQDVSEVFVTFRRNAKLGVEVTEELTKRTVSALAGLKEGKIAGLLALTTGKGGAELGKGLVDFFKIGGKTVGSRVDLALQAFNSLKTKFPEVMKSEFARTRLVMQTFGVADFETGVQLLESIETGNKKGATATDAVKKATEILTGTSGSIEMINNIIQNMMGRMFAIAVPALIALTNFAKNTVGGIKSMFSLASEESTVQEERDRWAIKRNTALQKLLDATTLGDQKAAEEARKDIKLADASEASLSKLTGITEKSSAISSNSAGLFDTMTDHLAAVKKNTKDTAMASKVTADLAASKMKIPLPTGGFTEITSPTALKNATKSLLDVKITLEDTTGVLKTIKKVSSIANYALQK